MDDRSRPRPAGPTCRTSLAKIVMSALLWPKIESAPSVTRMSGSTGLRMAYWMPPHAAVRSEIRGPVVAANFVRMRSRAKMIAK